MESKQNECCAGCGSCIGVGEGVYYYGKQLSVQERMEGACCRTKQTTTAFEIQGRGSEPVCGRCVLRRRLLLLLSALPCLAMVAFALARPELIPPTGPVRLGFFGIMALTLFPIWIWGRRAFSRTILLRDEVAASRARRSMRGKVAYERVNHGQIKGGLGGLGDGEDWASATTMRNYVFFTRRQYMRMGGADRGRS